MTHLSFKHIEVEISFIKEKPMKLEKIYMFNIVTNKG
jgi:hypothetical protein